MHKSVLAHVAAELPQKENLATAALVYILNRSESGRRALQSLIEERLGAIPPLGGLRREQANPDQSRPDVVLASTTGQRIGFIKVKFWAGLTDAQPVAYLKELAADEDPILVVLAPERRHPALRNEIRARCTAASVPLEEAGTEAMRCGAVRVALMAWNHLLDRLDQATIDDRHARADIQQLRGLCEQMESEGFVPLTREDLDDLATPRRYLMLADFVDEIVDRMVAEGVGSTQGLRVASRPEGYGRYVALARAGCWVGVDHRRWAQHGRTPLWLRFWPGPWGRAVELARALGPWLRANPPRAVVDPGDGVLLVPLLLQAGEVKSDALARAMAVFREMDAVLAGAGIAPLAAKGPDSE